MIGKRRHELERVRERAFRDVPRRGSRGGAPGPAYRSSAAKRSHSSACANPGVSAERERRVCRRALARAKKMPQQTRKHGLRLGRGLETRIGRARRARALRHPDQRGCRALSERHTHRVRLAIKLQLGVGKRVGRAARRPSLQRIRPVSRPKSRRRRAPARGRWTVRPPGRTTQRPRAVRPPRPSRVRVARRGAVPPAAIQNASTPSATLALPRRRNTRIRTLRVLETHER